MKILRKITGFGLKTPLIKPGDDIIGIIIEAVESNELELENGDIIIIAETPLAVAQNRLIYLENINATEKAKKLSKRFHMDPRFVQIIINESDKIYGGVTGVLLTEVDGILHANAGIDRSNAPNGSVVLLPENPQETAAMIRNKLEAHYNKKLAFIIADSRTQPLKRGVIGGALSVSGMEPIEDCRDKPDLYGYILKYTYRAIADDLCSFAQLLFGETDEQIPLVVIKGAEVEMTEKIEKSMHIPASECLFMNILYEKGNKNINQE